MNTSTDSTNTVNAVKPTKSVYVARLLTDTVTHELGSHTGFSFEVGQEAPPSRAELLERVAGRDAAIVTLTERIDEEFFAAAGPSLKVVANVAVGFDNIDLDAAARHGVVITNTPGVLDGATADHTFALILALGRRIVEADRFLHEGRDWVWGPRMFVGLDISAGATLGIIGLGRIGLAAAKRARAFDMRVIASDATHPLGTTAEGVEIVSQEELLATADVVTLHVPLLPSTRRLMGADTLAQMKPGAYLVNCARGGVVDETALIAAIDSGHLRGAAIDTFEGEPHVNPELLSRPQIVVTPHTASAGEATRDRMCRLAVDNVLAVLDGREPLTPVKAS
ncbi:D-glycerate dehydrogenase [Actinomyces sp. MRS3W]|uniref:2-hydroxyacid dehydrogenase n=1 Tax=Actinomyces sp. MRS3W TaxID=2800796 RepID=UPI0028FD0520|nr:D-glycerate dehydrogenase [Actinomyces sp. MRS3W]MDU0347652.1 D-glycerate dehydrogenase [Actinomyces sp. MRS3W]